MSSTTYGSVCSGIEAATCAWHPLGWKAEWLAEIEPFPSAVLAHHYPNTPNLGDMTKLAAQVLAGRIPAPDILVGGTPCQAFSVAGMRQGLLDPRGAITIKYVELADAIDHVRSRAGQPECITVWENVPGVLSDKGNAFGCFLGALAGEDSELQPAGKRWTDAGCVYGPKRTIAWRILDAQYFGLAQRRRRVFVVASARAGFDPAAVLFESEGVRRDTAPRRGEGQDIAGRAPFGLALQCGCGHIHDLSLGAWGCPDCEGDEGPSVEVMAGIPAFGGENQGGSLFQAGALNAHGVRHDFATETFCVQGIDVRNGVITGDVAHTVQAGHNAPDPGGTPHVLAVHGTQDPCVEHEMAHTLGRNSGQENAVFAIQAGALRTNPLSGPDGIGVQSDQAYTLEARAEVQAIAVALRGRKGGATAELGDDLAGTLRASTGGGDKPHALISSAVRRLTPTECERLQGFDDDYTMIPWRGKPAGECPDGPRYKAIGNSKAVPVVRWIGRRIQLQM
jgi:DNA (cytosine-5)-methyltransferase 1